MPFLGGMNETKRAANRARLATSEGNRLARRFAVMTSRRRESSAEFVELTSDPAQVELDRFQTRGHIVTGGGHGFADLRWSVAFQEGGKVLWMPSQRQRQSFKRPCAATTLHGVVLQLAHYGLRNLRSLRQFPLAQAQLFHALTDRSRDSSPIFRHVFLRAPPQARG